MSNKMKFNYMSIKENRFIWKQVEVKGSAVFMRIKKRPIIIIKEIAEEGAL